MDKCVDLSNSKKDCKKKDNNNYYRCGKPGHRPAQCKIEIEVKQESNANAVHVEIAATKPKSEFTAFGLGLKIIKSSYAQFKGLFDTGADLCLMRRNIFLQLGNETLTRKEKCFTGIGESQILPFGSIVIPVEIDNMHIKMEFHVVPDEDMGFDAILGRTILDIVDMKVTKECTEFMRRYESKSNEDKHINFGSKFLRDFKNMCAEQAAVSEHIILSHLNQSQQSAVKSHKAHNRN